MVCFTELNYNQKDEDNLPPYDILDTMLKQLVEEESMLQDDAPLTSTNKKLYEVERLIRNSEFKRLQSPIGPKISTRCFNFDRLYPAIRKIK